MAAQTRSLAHHFGLEDDFTVSQQIRAAEDFYSADDFPAEAPPAEEDSADFQEARLGDDVEMEESCAWQWEPVERD